MAEQYTEADPATEAVAATVAELVDRAKVEQLAKSRYASALPRAQANQVRYEDLHRLYAPVDGDQWPKDRMERPGKLHVTANIVRAFVDTEARLLSILPRVTNKPDAEDKATLQRSETCEKLYMRWLEASGWDVWMLDLNREKAIYSIGYLKPFWNEEEKRPDVSVVEQPQNLLVGWGASDHSVVDWAIYSYKVSRLQAQTRWPDIEIEHRKGGEPLVSRKGTDHSDPLAQKGSFIGGLASIANMVQRRTTPMEGEYESEHLTVWDYWYQKPGGPICNSILLQGVVVEGPHEHPEYPTIPYIPVEHDHEPGSPDGMSTAELLVDIQLGLNRAISHLAQYVADETDTAYQLNGENADSIPEGLLPKGGEIIAAGAGNAINPISKGVNQVPLQVLIDTYWQTAHKVTGLPEILFGVLSGAQTSGRATAVQIEAAANRLTSKRARLYRSIQKLFLFWGYMVEQKDITIKVSAPADQPTVVDPNAEPQALQTRDVKLSDVVKGLNRWRILPPEITPRDNIEHTNNIINLVNARLMPLEMAMDEVGVENPQQALAMIEAEGRNAGLFPERAQALAAVQSTLLALFQAMQQAGMAGDPRAAANAGMGAQAAAQQQAQQASPALTEDQNQPMTQPGSPPPPGSPAPALGGDLQMLVRQTPGGESQAMSQISMKRKV